MDETYADFVLNATAAMEQRSRGTPMERKLHFVSNVVLNKDDFAKPKLSAWKKLIRGTRFLGSRMTNDHHEADGQLVNLVRTGQGPGNVEENAAVLSNFSKLLKQEGSTMKLIVGELDGFSNPGACDHCQLRALQTAAFLNLYQSRADLVKAVCYVNAFERLQQEQQGSSWYQGQVLVLPNMTIREPPYYVIKMVSEATQRNVVRSALSSANGTAPGPLLQLFATASDDGRSVAVRILNQGCADRTVRLRLRGAAGGAGAPRSVNGTMLRCRVPTTTGCGDGEKFAMMNEANTPARPEAVVPEPARAAVAADGSVVVALPHWSFVTLALQAA